MYRRWLHGEVTIAPAAATETSPRLAADDYFYTKRVIILAALLCSIIAALGLNSIIRYGALRFRWRLGPETEGRAAVTGLKKKELRRIPVAIFGSGEGAPETECPICLGEFVDGEEVRVLPKCNHGFHVWCIDKWLRSHSSCPTCRQSLIEHKPGSGSGGCS